MKLSHSKDPEAQLKPISRNNRRSRQDAQDDGGRQPVLGGLGRSWPPPGTDMTRTPRYYMTGLGAATSPSLVQPWTQPHIDLNAVKLVFLGRHQISKPTDVRWGKGGGDEGFSLARRHNLTPVALSGALWMECEVPGWGQLVLAERASMREERNEVCSVNSWSWRCFGRLMRRGDLMISEVDCARPL